MLNDRMLRRALNFGRQAAFAVEALMYRRIRLCLVDQPIQWVVAILAMQGCGWGGHWLTPQIKNGELEYLRRCLGGVLAELIVLEHRSFS
ncbi:hypothetical protein PMm318_A56780 [Pseudomonas moorei]